MKLAILLALLAAPAHALDWQATRESVWARYVAYPPPPVALTDARLRLALEVGVLGAIAPQSIPTATPHGIRLKYWDRVIGQHGLALVADDYISFLRKVKADLEREQQNQPAKNQN